MVLLDPNARLVIAHRGDRAHAPENTLNAFERAVAIGADAIECDVRLTSDGHVVLMHDATVDRTTDASGAVRELTLAAVRGLGVPLLSEALELLPSTPFLVECKTVDVAAAAVAIVTAHRAHDRVLFGAFPGAALAIVRASGLATIATRGELVRMIPAALARWIPRAKPPYQAIAVPPAWRRIPLPVLGYARTSGVPVHVWTINDADAAVAYWRGGVCGILTDDPARMIAARADAGITTHGPRKGNTTAN